MNWWNALTDMQKLFASVAAPATLILVLQFVLLIFGLGHEGGVDSPEGADAIDGIEGDDIADVSQGVNDVDAFDSDPDAEGGHDRTDALRLFTLRGIIAFLSVGGWMGIAAIDWGLHPFTAIVLAFVAGCLALSFVAWSIRAFVRMQQSGNVRRENAIGKEGEVYLTIPEKGHGKVNVIVQDRLCEMEAITKADRVIKTGEKVWVIDVTTKGMLIVEPKNDRTENIPTLGRR